MKLIDIEKKYPKEKRSLEHRLYADTFNDLNRIVHENKDYLGSVDLTNPLVVETNDIVSFYKDLSQNSPVY